MASPFATNRAPRWIVLTNAMVLIPALACGGDDKPDTDSDAGDNPSYDGAPIPDADPSAPDAGVEPDFSFADGVFLVMESLWTQSETPSESSQIRGQVLAGEWGEPGGATVFHTVTMESGSCRLLEYVPHYCDGCAGVCTPDDVCVEWPNYRDVGEVSATVDTQDYPLTDYGYHQYYGGATPADLFAAGDPIEISATGAEAIDSFELAAVGVDRPALTLQGADEDSLILVDGGDFVVSWGTADPQARVRLVLKTPNASHGMPLNAIIECEGPDTGSFVIPQAIVEAFPQQGHGAPICVGHDCPPSLLQRYTRSSVVRDGLVIELRAASEISFAAVHEP